MARKLFSITPVALGINTSSPELNTNQLYSPRVVNARIDQNSVIKRWGYSLDRTLGGPVYNIVLYQKYDGTRYTLYLTDTDLCSRESAGTWSYKTEATTTVSVTSMNGAKTVITASGGGFTASGVAAGDKFIITADLTATSEPDANWATVASKDSDTQITLSAAYTGATGTGACTLRKVYSIPTNERWSYAIVGEKFCFTNGNVDVQYWTGSGNATALDSTNAKSARYCIEYANRLFLADLTISGLRSPITVKWSAEGDVTDWTDSTAGENDFLETDDFITGLGRVGPNLVVYKRDSIIIGSRSGDPTAPVTYNSPSVGIGLVAPWSLVSFMGTNAWIGRDDFYMMNGDQPVSIGKPIRDKFFSQVGESEVERTFGYVNYNANEVYWCANTDEGKRVFVWNYKTDQWSKNEYPLNVQGYGTGAV
jgi:hypothetical protein